MSAGAHAAPPRSDHVPHPHRHLLHPLRPPFRWLLRRRWDVVVHGAAHVPARGPVILAPNHIGVIDGPLVAIVAPRPVHALTKSEMFVGRTGTFLRHAGQIPLDRWRTDVAAVRSCLRVLRDGGVVGVFPEGRRGDGELTRLHGGAAYLALVAGAPIVPVALFGTRQPGADADALPPRGARIDVAFGEPLGLVPQPWPRRRADVVAATGVVHDHLRRHLDAARVALGQELPGPLPPGQTEPDPALGVTEQGAP
ncbi:1-acyl-sn-glycerol-3-phosphate acyltransferase [Nocardioides sp. TRM66260-LWL]|uniref:lysophospholipid acyltransferase family protein n=1 Tax=Nocardioides sp. TRM66260-LWL TaxID=2874478 RepID=UPI001CC79BA5|nr:lysophospholipid acyltransferase family protein [Nocardioides sp. TRM66260-LWL]MBZ5734117.1 1-acyl-sn-glycerol-3-phosphate acyltransferase [Nocardioides sp. TRM66260-LWL]